MWKISCKRIQNTSLVCLHENEAVYYGYLQMIVRYTVQFFFLITYRDLILMFQKKARFVELPDELIA